MAETYIQSVERRAREAAELERLNRIATELSGAKVTGEATSKRDTPRDIMTGQVSSALETLGYPGGERGAYQYAKNNVMPLIENTPAGMITAAGDIQDAGSDMERQAMVGAMFMGPGAKNADHARLSLANYMKELGDSPQKIWKETGWTKGGQDWSWEIDDSRARWKPGADASMARVAYMKDVLDHPELYENYPFLADMPIVSKRMPPGHFGGLAANPKNPQPDDAGIILNEELVRMNPEEALSTLLHELQHGVQMKEGWGMGATANSVDPKLAASSYFELEDDLEALKRTYTKNQGSMSDDTRQKAEEALRKLDAASMQMRAKEGGPGMYGYYVTDGEVQARNTQHRRKWTMARRSQELPADSASVYERHQIPGPRRKLP